MRPIFCGNFEYDTRQSDLERLFSKYGRVERVDMKSGIFFWGDFILQTSFFIFLLFIVFFSWDFVVDSLIVAVVYY